MMLQLNTVTDLPSISPASQLTHQRRFALPPGAAARFGVFTPGVLQRAGVGQRCGRREAALLPQPRGEGEPGPSLQLLPVNSIHETSSGCKAQQGWGFKKQTNKCKSAPRLLEL